MTLSTLGRLGRASLIGVLVATNVLVACGSFRTDPNAAPQPTATSVPEPTPSPTPVPTPTASPTPIAVPFPAFPAPTMPAPRTNVFGIPVGGDAAPASEQYLVLNYSREGSAMDFAVSARDRAGGGFDSSMSLVMLGKDMEAVPGAALGWESSSDMTRWTFHIDPGLQWSDETPVTAGDFVFTWQYYADPEHDYDFADYFARLGVANWNRVNLDVLPLTDLGVEATDDHTLVFHLDRPTPHVPRFMVYGTPLARHQALQYGVLYGNNPETAVSFTPWILTDWTPNRHSMFEPNPEYSGRLQPKIERVKLVFGENGFDQYMAGQIDSLSAPFGSADQGRMLSDPDMAAELGVSPGAFRTHYLAFDFRREVFNDERVRQALARAIDRDLLVSRAVGEGIAVPSRGVLMAGFPDAVTVERRAAQAFDLAAAKTMLAAAGYPDGGGFPRIEIDPRRETKLTLAVASEAAEQLGQNLGIEIDVVIGDDRATSTAAGVERTPILAMESVSADYIDASAFLDVFRTDGRHNWNYGRFEELRIAASKTADPEERRARLAELQSMLADRVAGVFLWSELEHNLNKPYLKGPWRDENSSGRSGLQPPGWSPGFGAYNIYTVYVSDEVDGYARSPF